MKKLLLLSNAFIGFWCCLASTANAQGVGINPSGNPPANSAMLDVSATDKGMLIPRLTTAQRNAITSPDQSLLIYNTTTRCFETYEVGFWQTIWCSCTPVVASVSISASPSGAICQGTSVTFSATPSNGGTTPAYQWKKGGIVINGATNSTYTSTTLANSDVITCVMTSNANCVLSSPATSNAITMIVNAPPTAASAGYDINPACGVSAVTLAGNTPSVGTGNWSVISGTATITTPGSPTSGVTGLAILTPPSTATLRWTISNSPCTPSTDDVIITTIACPPALTPCTWNGSTSFTVTHTIGSVAPETKTITYSQTQTTLSGASKCWIIQNLGATNPATSATDATEASAGWYWQFNKKQGFKHDGTTRTPSTTWINSVSEASDWIAANDPCTIELGAGWRVPTNTELINADANGQVGGWDNYNETYASELKLHAAGLLWGDGSFSDRGNVGMYWSSKRTNNTDALGLYFDSSSSDPGAIGKHFGLTLRCIRD